MKFLLDVGISPRLGDLLVKEGHGFRYVPDHFPNSISDKEILEIASASNEVVITHDTDFGQLLAFSGASSPSVVLFRIHHIRPKIFFDLIVQNWGQIEPHLSQGAIVIFDESNLRIRRLLVVR